MRFLLPVLSLALVTAALADEPSRQVFEYVDESGTRRFTSDPQIAATRWTGPLASPGEDEPLERDERSVAESLQQYVETYLGPSLSGAKVVLNLQLGVSVPLLDTGRPDDLRRVIEKAELLASIDAAPGAGTVSLRDELARVLFPPLRALYPNAHLTVTVHDGLHTLCRAEWSVDQGEPVVRVR